MSKVKMINVDALPNIPWQERPADLKTETPVWRYSGNPVMGRNPTPAIARIFNSAVVPWEDGFIAVLRGEQVNGVPYVYLGHSKDGIHWDVEPEKVPITDENGQSRMPNYSYDPRLVKVEDMYYVIWCGDFYGASIGMAKTKDFKTFTRLENPFIPFNRIRLALLITVAAAFGLSFLVLDRIFFLTDLTTQALTLYAVLAALGGSLIWLCDRLLRMARK